MRIRDKIVGWVLSINEYDFGRLYYGVYLLIRNMFYSKNQIVYIQLNYTNENFTRYYGTLCM